MLFTGALYDQVAFYRNQIPANKSAKGVTAEQIFFLEKFNVNYCRALVSEMAARNGDKPLGIHIEING